MSFKERLVHSIMFEMMLIVIFTLTIKYITDYEMTKVFTLVISLTVIAVVWNFIFNWIFDKYVIGAREDRSLKIRAIHALLFEIGLIVPTIPLIAYYLNISLFNAIVMDIGFIAFVLVFTVIYNYFYDRVRLSFVDEK